MGKILRVLLQLGEFALSVLASAGSGAIIFAVAIRHAAVGAFYAHHLIRCCALSAIGAFLAPYASIWFRLLIQGLLAYMVGAEIYSVRIGSGLTLLRAHLCRISLNIRLSLGGSIMILALLSKRFFRTRMATMLILGPIASVCLVAASVFLLYHHWPRHGIVDASFYYFFPFLCGWTFACCVSIIAAPWLLTVLTYEEIKGDRAIKRPTLLSLLFMNGVDIERHIEWNRTEADYKYFDTTTKSLQKALDRALAKPRDPVALRTAALFLEMEKDPRELDFYRRLIRLRLSPPIRMVFIDILLTSCLNYNLVSVNAVEMDQLSVELLASDPKNVSLQGTRGSVLVDLGRIEEGKAILLEVLAKTTSDGDRFYVQIFLALVAQAEGDLTLAQFHAGEAVKLRPDHPALQRVTGLI